MRERLGLLTLSKRRRYLRLQSVYKIVNDYRCPRQLQGRFALRSELHRKALRDSKELKGGSRGGGGSGGSVQPPRFSLRTLEIMFPKTLFSKSSTPQKGNNSPNPPPNPP